MAKRLKPLPKFKNEDEERDFWANADTSDYFDWSKAQKVVFSIKHFIAEKLKDSAK